MDWEEYLKSQQVIFQYPGSGKHAVYGLSGFGAYNKHSDFYFNSDYLSSQPSILKEVSAALHKAVEPKLPKRPDWIVTYAPYGLNLAFCLADLFQCRLAYVASLEQAEIHFEIRGDEAILFCADDLQTGGSFRKIESILAEKGAASMPPLCVVANLSGSATFEGREVVALINKNVTTWDASDCRLCQNGSDALPARKHWLELLRKSSDAVD